VADNYENFGRVISMFCVEVKRKQTNIGSHIYRHEHLN